MIRVGRPKTLGGSWPSWFDAAQAALTHLRSQYRPGLPPPLNAELYSRAKPFLLEVFHNKCAYCESAISNAQPGDVEHYRPKGRIRDLDGSVIRVRINDEEMDHPGYWWLSYDWENLLPSCADCNRPRYHPDRSTLAGKGDLFPVEGSRAVDPDDKLVLEHPLLLDPTHEEFDPAKHFDLLPNGWIQPKTKEAQTTCEILGLNIRENLVKARVSAYRSAKCILKDFLHQAANDDALSPDAIELGEELNEMWAGHTPYTSFARLALVEAARRLEKRNFRLTFPISLQNEFRVGISGRPSSAAATNTN